MKKEDYLGHATRNSERIYKFLSEGNPRHESTRKPSQHGRGSDWLKENRRRRAAGIPQKRVLPFDAGIYDPFHGTVTKWLEDGSYEVTYV